MIYKKIKYWYFHLYSQATSNHLSQSYVGRRQVAAFNKHKFDGDSAGGKLAVVKLRHEKIRLDPVHPESATSNLEVCDCNL